MDARLRAAARDIEARFFGGACPVDDAPPGILAAAAGFGSDVSAEASVEPLTESLLLETMKALREAQLVARAREVAAWRRLQQRVNAWLN